jgi:CubicO group peptidase (beta-lactamase class C family)
VTGVQSVRYDSCEIEATESWWDRILTQRLMILSRHDSVDFLIGGKLFGYSRGKMNFPICLAGALVSILILPNISLAGAPPGDTAAVLETIRKKHDLPALAVAVVKDGKICDRAAVGVRKYGDPTPVTIDDQFHIGSCTKSMTATLTAMFIEEGKLRWNSTIAEVLPDLKDKMDKQYETVTLEQLLTHRGGVPGKPPSAAWAKARLKQGTPKEQRLEFITSVLSQPPEAKPGTRFIYSNQGYALVGVMLEKIADKPWESLITERLFEPLKMKSAGFGVPGTMGRVDQPWGHVRDGEKIRPVQSDNPPAIGPAGTVHCSLEDMARYTMIHLGHGQGDALLKPESFRKLHTPPEGADYACGWGIAKRGWAGGNALQHAGSNTMWFLVMWLAPEKNFSVVAATNIAGPDAEKGCDEVAAAMIKRWLSE